MGRRVGQFAIFALAGLIAILATVQITHQVFFPPSASDAPSLATCRDGLAVLYRAIDRGRQAAERGDDRDEEAALLRYREAVAPDWRHRDRVAALCRSNEQDLATLDAIERLRYSEEHSVRHSAVELSALRQQVRQLVEADVR
jgi:hypothetical protein